MGSGDQLHVRPEPADVGPDHVEPRRGDLGDLRRLGVDDLVAGVVVLVLTADDPSVTQRCGAPKSTPTMVVEAFDTRSSLRDEQVLAARRPKPVRPAGEI